MNLVQYLAINRHQIPAGTIAAYVRDGLVDVAVNQAEISPRLVVAFTALSSRIVDVLLFRNAPGETPWCPVVIDRRTDANWERIMPELRRGRIVVPVPDQLISVTLARQISGVGTDLTRFFEPPSWLRDGNPPPTLMLRGE